MNKFIDSNVIIYAFTNNTQKQKCRKILNEENLIANTLVLLHTKNLGGRKMKHNLWAAIHK